MNRSLIGFVFVSLFWCSFASNLTCYQCKRSTLEECGAQDLKPCSSTFDRCATHISKNAKDGFSIKRECGLAPCGFEDEVVANGLGMNCDRSRDEYSCTICCKENGCNKSNADVNRASFLIILAIIVISLLNVARDFIPPYVMSENSNLKK